MVHITIITYVDLRVCLSIFNATNAVAESPVIRHLRRLWRPPGWANMGDPMRSKAGES